MEGRTRCSCRICRTFPLHKEIENAQSGVRLPGHMFVSFIMTRNPAQQCVRVGGCRWAVGRGSQHHFSPVSTYVWQ